MRLVPRGVHKVGAFGRPGYRFVRDIKTGRRAAGRGRQRRGGMAGLRGVPALSMGSHVLMTYINGAAALPRHKS